MINETNKEFEKAKELFESFDFEKLTGGLNKTIEKIPVLMKPLQDELSKLNNPTSKKNVKINGSACVVSLIEDGRVIIAMPTKDEAQLLYDNINQVQVKTPFWKKIFK
jgi:cytochrome oxidase Cu insertion factor (SCO1/SenC/PrrC family)